MKKRIFSLMAVVFFAGSLMSIAPVDNPVVESENDYDCYEQVETMVIQADNAGWSMEELAWLTNGAYAVFCYGYTWDDVYAAG